ncbi:MAG: transcriptional regulator BetI [Gammaproteobacteria bacterium]|nr:transcriptional regulator BetI [Gammaproteobacteria bacterium]
MPKVGVKPLRRQQLIEATLESVALHGLQNTTIITISRIAGMSSGIISHYFGGKQELIEASIKHMLDQLQQALLERIRVDNLSPHQRLILIIEANFTPFQRTPVATKTWLSFWAQSMHNSRLARLQSINSRRLYSNLCFSFKQIFDDQQAIHAAKQTAAMIDGFWLRSALSPDPKQEFILAETLCKKFIHDLLKQPGETHVPNKI